MANFLVDLLLSLVLSKKARRNLKAYNRAVAAQKKPAAGAAGKGSTREQQIKAMQDNAKGLVTEDRAELIRKAMEIRKAKQTVLANLDDAQRQKLVALALKKLMNESPKGQDDRK
ncbi:MAG: hypothetical protein H7840_00970 [Alphaproteobacteria bacterium]